MLDTLPDDYQKTPGFPAWDFLRAFALAVLSLSDDVAIAESKLDVDALSGTELDAWVHQRRGLTRKHALAATAVLRVVAGTGTVRPGDLFATAGGIQFQALDTASVSEGDTFTVEAVIAGRSGNVGAGTITRIPVTVSGLGAVTNDAAASGGYEAESDADLRARYYTDLRTPANGANQQAYLNWAMEIPGVGRAKVFPQALGPQTVEVCILDADMAPASTALIAQVQNAIDPNKSGDGVGLAPIGAACTVTTATKKTVSVSVAVTVAAGYEKDAVQAGIQASIVAYLQGLAFSSDYISYAQLSSKVHDVPGVADYSTLRLDGGVDNVSLGARETPVLGNLVVT